MPMSFPGNQYRPRNPLEPRRPLTTRPLPARFPGFGSVSQLAAGPFDEVYHVRTILVTTVMFFRWWDVDLEKGLRHRFVELKEN